MNLSLSTVYKCVQRHEQNGNFKNTPGRGRKKKLSTSDEKHLKYTSLRNRRKSSKELTRYLEEATGKNVFSRLVPKTLTAAVLGGYVAVRKPMLRKRNKRKRLIWTRTHKIMDACAMEKSYVHRWEKVWTIWKQFQAVCGTPKRREVQVWLYFTNREAWRGSVQVWGSITYSGVGNLYKITDNLTAPK